MIYKEFSISYFYTMDILTIFMRELFDYNIDYSNHLDTKTNSIKMGSVNQDPMLIKNLVFRFLWKSIYGVWPSRLHGKLFMEKNPHVSKIETEDFIRFCREMMPVYNYIQIDLNNLEKEKQAFIDEISNGSKKAKEHLALKFCYRYGVDEDIIKMSDSLLNIFKSCIFDKNAFRRIQMLNIGLAKQQDKEPCELPEMLLTLNDYYRISSQIIEYYELGNFNVFNKYYNVYNKYWKDYGGDIDFSDNTIFDVINFTTANDSSFNRYLLGSVVIYVESGEVFQFNRLKNLLLGANSKDNRNLIVFSNDLYVPSDSNVYMMKFDIFDPFFMNYVPRSASNFIMISNKKYPVCPSISLKSENSIYHCLLEERNTVLNHYYKSFNRYTCNYDTYKKLNDDVNTVNKAIYIIADEREETDHIIYNKHFIEHQWNAHLVTPCPYNALNNSTYQPRMNVLLYDQFVLKYYMENNTQIDNVKTVTSKDKKNAIVIVDNRPNIFSVICLKITLSNMKRDEWSIVVFCNQKNKDFFKTYLGEKVEFNTRYPLPSKKFDIEIYNNLLKNPLFWGHLTNYENVLFVQDDCMIVKKGVEDKFLNFDYVGAPWEKKWAIQDPNKYLMENINPELVGNGGLSLRKTKHMKMICEKYRHISHQLHYDRLQQQPEDVFFSYGCQQEKLKTPTYEEAQEFSSEQVYKPNSFGFHKTWVYHGLSTIKDMFNHYLSNPINKFPDIQEQ